MIELDDDSARGATCGVHLYPAPVDRCQRCIDAARELHGEPLPEISRAQLGGLAAARLRRGEVLRSSEPRDHRARTYEYDGKTLTVRQWAARPEVRARGITRAMIYLRLLKLGWSFADAITRPRTVGKRGRVSAARRSAA